MLGITELCLILLFPSVHNILVQRVVKEPLEGPFGAAKTFRVSGLLAYSVDLVLTY